MKPRSLGKLPRLVWTKIRLKLTTGFKGLQPYHSQSIEVLVWLFAKSLLYNSHVNVNYAIDTLLDPIFYFIDHHLSYIEPIFVLIVFLMLSGFILVAYILGVPFWYQRSPLTLTVASLLGHWLLVNVLWNYFKALYTLPGFASDRRVIDPVGSFCKKCPAPRPARAHHCSVCKRCILKMDHHCPWLHNCIGHFNHRYFYFFCAYTWLGTIFVAIFGVWLAVDHLFPEWSPFEPMFFPLETDPNLLYWIIQLCNTKLRTRLIVYEGLVTILLFILLGWLLHYHTGLISAGETCIERHMNAKCRLVCLRRGLRYQNPYDFGPRHNWKRFLGFDRNRWPWLHVLLPSNFAPIGDGFTWFTMGPAHIVTHVQP